MASGSAGGPRQPCEGGGIVREISGRDTGLAPCEDLEDNPVPWLTNAARAPGDIPIMTTGPIFGTEIVSD